MNFPPGCTHAKQSVCARLALDAFLNYGQNTEKVMFHGMAGGAAQMPFHSLCVKETTLLKPEDLGILDPRHCFYTL